MNDATRPIFHFLGAKSRMNDAAQQYEAQIIEGIEKVSRDDWNAVLAPDDSPFVEWDWLCAMEKSGSAARNTGWEIGRAHV